MSLMHTRLGSHRCWSNVLWSFSYWVLCSVERNRLQLWAITLYHNGSSNREGIGTIPAKFKASSSPLGELPYASFRSGMTSRLNSKADDACWFPTPSVLVRCLGLSLFQLLKLYRVSGWSVLSGVIPPIGNPESPGAITLARHPDSLSIILLDNPALSCLSFQV